MRALLWVTVLAFAGWSGWWWFAQDRAVAGAEHWFASQRAAGWQAERQGIAVAGFPNRIDLTIDQPRLVSPGGAWGWQAPFVQIFALSYRPWHLIAALPPEQQLTTPAGPARLTAASLRSSLVLVPGADLALDRLQLAGEQLALGGPLDLTLAQLSIATRPTLDRALSHDLGIELTGIGLPPGLIASLPAGLLPAEIDRLRLDAALGFSAALDRHIGQTQPELTALALRDAELHWGPIRLQASGTLTPDAAGFAEGRLDLRLEGAREVLDLAQAIGLLTADTRPAWETMLGTLAPAGQPLDLPLRLSGGLIQLGPMVLGPAPRLRF